LLDFRSCWIVFIHVARGRPGEHVRWTTKQPHLLAIVQARRLSLFGRIACMPDETDAKKILTASPWRTGGGDHWDYVWSGINSQSKCTSVIVTFKDRVFSSRYVGRRYMTDHCVPVSTSALCQRSSTCRAALLLAQPLRPSVVVC